MPLFLSHVTKQSPSDTCISHVARPEPGAAPTGPAGDCISQLEQATGYSGLHIGLCEPGSCELALKKWAPSWGVTLDSWAYMIEPDPWQICHFNSDPRKPAAGCPASLSLTPPLYTAMFRRPSAFCSVLSLNLQANLRIREVK